MPEQSKFQLALLASRCVCLEGASLCKACSRCTPWRSAGSNKASGTPSAWVHYLQMQITCTPASFPLGRESMLLCCCRVPPTPQPFVQGTVAGAQNSRACLIA
eukprot:scaffold285211_cov15-Tisochrysis_lutea.AAC.1